MYRILQWKLSRIVHPTIPHLPFFVRNPGIHLHYMSFWGFLVVSVSNNNWSYMCSIKYSPVFQTRIFCFFTFEQKWGVFIKISIVHISPPSVKISALQCQQCIQQDKTIEFKLEKTSFGYKSLDYIFCLDFLPSSVILQCQYYFGSVKKNSNTTWATWNVIF